MKTLTHLSLVAVLCLGSQEAAAQSYLPGPAPLTTTGLCPGGQGNGINQLLTWMKVNSMFVIDNRPLPIQFPFVGDPWYGYRECNFAWLASRNTTHQAVQTASVRPQVTPDGNGNITLRIELLTDIPNNIVTAAALFLDRDRSLTFDTGPIDERHGLTRTNVGGRPLTGITTTHDQTLTLSPTLPNMVWPRRMIARVAFAVNGIGGGPPPYSGSYHRGWVVEFEVDVVGGNTTPDLSEINKPQAYLAVDGIVGSPLTVARSQRSAPTVSTLEVGGLTGNPFLLGVSFSPALNATQVTPIACGQLWALNPGTTTVLAGSSLGTLSVPVPWNSPIMLTVQMATLDPSACGGGWLSQPAELLVQ